MGEENAEVRISLVADDLSDAVVKAVKQGITELREETEKTRDAAGEKEGGLASAIFKSQLKFTALKEAAELVTASIHEAYEMTEMLADAAMEAAEAQEQQERAMAGNLFLMDHGAHSMGEIRDYAKDTREEFAQFGVQVGVSTAKIADAYDALISKGTMGSEQAKELAQQMAVVGKVVPGGMDSLAQGFSMVELGMVRARNPVVQLIAATHVLQGNAHAVADAMMKMNPEQQMKLGEEAIRRQSKALGEFGQGIGAPSMEEVRTSLEGVKEQFLESMGEPMKNALVPRLIEVRAFLVEHIEEIKKFGHDLGNMAAEVISYITEAIHGVYEGIHQDWDELKHLGQEFAAAWKEIAGSSVETRTQFRILADDLVKVFAGLLSTVEMANDIAHVQKIGTTEMGVQQRIVEDAAGHSQGAEGLANFKREVEKYKLLQAEMGEAGTATAGEAMTDQFKNLAMLARAPARRAETDLEAGNVAGYDKYLEAAIQRQDKGAEEYAFHLLVGSGHAKEALELAGGHIVGGMEALMRIVSDRAPELFAQVQKEMHSTIKGEGGIQAPQHNINFIRAHFDLHQDFKDVDPERVIALFKRGVVRSAVARIESRVATPFGL